MELFHSRILVFKDAQQQKSTLSQAEVQLTKAVTFLVSGYLPSPLSQVQPHLLSLSQYRLLCTWEGQTCSSGQLLSFVRPHTSLRLQVTLSLCLVHSGCCPLAWAVGTEGQHCREDLPPLASPVPGLLLSPAEALVHIGL